MYTKNSQGFQWIFFSPNFAGKTLRLRNSYPQLQNDGNSCNIQIHRILNGGILSFTVGFSAFLRDGLHNTKSKDGNFAYTYYTESLVSTQQKSYHIANMNIAAYVNKYIYIHISSYLCLKIEMKSTTHSRKKRNTTSTNSNPNVATTSNSKKKKNIIQHPNTKIEFDTQKHRPKSSPQSNRFIPKGTKEPMLWLN